MAKHKSKAKQSHISKTDNNQPIPKQIIIKASRGAAAQGVTAKPTGCGFEPHSRR